MLTYNPELKHNARKLRSNMTDEERKLWYDFLCDLPLRIYRQKVIGNYIVDFYCRKNKTVIEIDGSQHYETDGVESDARRDKYLSSVGITVLRYSNNDVNNEFEAVCNDIYNRLGLTGK